MTLPFGASSYVEDLMKKANDLPAKDAFTKKKSKSTKDLLNQTNDDIAKNSDSREDSCTKEKGEAAENKMAADLSIREQKLAILLTVMDNLLS